MLRKISFKNYRSFKVESSIELKQITMLFGTNSAGKSSIMKLFLYIREVLNEGNWDIQNSKLVEGMSFGGLKNLIWNKDIDKSLELELLYDFSNYKDNLIDFENKEFNPNAIRYSLQNAIDQNNELEFKYTAIKDKFKVGFETIKQEDGIISDIIITDKYFKSELFIENEWQNLFEIQMEDNFFNDILIKGESEAKFYYNTNNILFYNHAFIHGKDKKSILSRIKRDKNFKFYDLFDEYTDIVKMDELFLDTITGKNDYFSKNCREIAAELEAILGSNIIEKPIDSVFIFNLPNLINYYHNTYGYEKLINKKKYIPANWNEKKAKGLSRKDYKWGARFDMALNRMLIRDKIHYEAFLSNIFKLIYIPGIRKFNQNNTSLDDLLNVNKWTEYRSDPIRYDMINSDIYTDDNEEINEHSLTENQYFVEKKEQIRVINNRLRGMGIGYELVFGINSSLKSILDKVSNQDNQREIINNAFNKIDSLKEYLLVDKMSNTNVSISEVGSGIIQVLPIIYLTTLFTNRLILIEQPELHLHPGQQVELAKHLVWSHKKRYNQLVIETHSEHIIKAFQLEIAKYKTSNGKDGISSNRLSINYVEKSDDKHTSVIRKIELNEEGSFTEPWPDNFFDASADLTIERLKLTNKN